MEEMIIKWVKETITEYERAKRNQNLFRMREMETLARALRTMRDNLLKFKA